MQALLGSYRWDWADLRGGTGGGVAAVRPGLPDRAGNRGRRDRAAQARGRDRVRGPAARRVHRPGGELRDYRVLHSCRLLPAAAGQFPGQGAGLAIPRSLPPCHRRRRRPRWSARSESRSRGDGPVGSCCQVQGDRSAAGRRQDDYVGPEKRWRLVEEGPIGPGVVGPQCLAGGQVESLHHHVGTLGKTHRHGGLIDAGRARGPLEGQGSGWSPALKALQGKQLTGPLRAAELPRR